MKKAIERLKTIKSVFDDLWRIGIRDGMGENKPLNDMTAMLAEVIAELESPPRWETPEQYRERTGKAWPDNGSVELVDCVKNANSRWAKDGMWHWVLKDPRPCKPIPIKGALGLWEYNGIYPEVETI